MIVEILQLCFIGEELFQSDAATKYFETVLVLQAGDYKDQIVAVVN